MLWILGRRYLPTIRSLVRSLFNSDRTPLGNPLLRSRMRRGKECGAFFSLTSIFLYSYARHVTPIPDGLPLEQAAPILCAGVTVYRALLNSKARVSRIPQFPSFSAH